MHVLVHIRIEGFWMSRVKIRGCHSNLATWSGVWLLLACPEMTDWNLHRAGQRLRGKPNPGGRLRRVIHLLRQATCHLPLSPSGSFRGAP